MLLKCVEVGRLRILLAGPKSFGRYRMLSLVCTYPPHFHLQASVLQTPIWPSKHHLTCEAIVRARSTQSDLTTGGGEA